MPNLASAAGFSDVPTNFWAHDEIHFLTNEKIINGYPDGSFKPVQSITKIQSANTIIRSLQLDTNNRPNPNFKDMPASPPITRQLPLLLTRES
ncbi:S-layer homology domain-containing protein [Peribacillus loiseleuriae]|uniref:S-layer homology domain-containing protein n=1 Tax=Peribacillus loiseleuriae TaxID=1679170 RepID=UPI003D03FD5E